MPAERAWLGLGANLGDRAATIREAVRRLADHGEIEIERVSRLYRAPPWGDLDQGEFLNAAVAVRTTLPPRSLLDLCLRMERDLGRVRGRRWGPRAIDIDIVAYDGVVTSELGLTLPHPSWRERAFVLVPLIEIAPDLVIGGDRVADVLARLDAKGIVPFGEAM